MGSLGLRAERGNVAIVVAVLIGGVVIAGLIALYITADKESEAIHEEMIDEVIKAAEDPKFGFGVDPDGRLVEDPDKYLAQSKQSKPIIFLYETE